MPSYSQKKATSHLPGMETLNYPQIIWEKPAHLYLKGKLQEPWKPIEPLTLIDLGNDYYPTKFELLENAQKVLRGDHGL